MGHLSKTEDSCMPVPERKQLVTTPCTPLLYLLIIMRDPCRAAHGVQAAVGFADTVLCLLAADPTLLMCGSRLIPAALHGSSGA